MALKLYPFKDSLGKNLLFIDEKERKVTFRELSETENNFSHFTDYTIDALLCCYDSSLIDTAVRKFLHNTASTDLNLHDCEVNVPLLENFQQIWGAGLNFQSHAHDLSATQPTFGPSSYLRPASSVICNNTDIILPYQSQRVTAEAELGIIIGKKCKNISANDAYNNVIGFTTILDMTAEDAILINPRYIPWAKGFDTFCSIGPNMVLKDQTLIDNLEKLTIQTKINGEIIAEDTVKLMKYSPAELIEYFSAGRTLPAGTIISTGTPGAGIINPGDLIEATVSSIGSPHHKVKHTIHPL